MARKRDLTKKQQDMIDKAFKEVETVNVFTEFGKISLISLDEMPIMQMKRFMRVPNEEKIFHMLDFMKLCLVDPNDWDKIASLPVKKVNSIIQQWMSGNVPTNEEEE